MSSRTVKRKPRVSNFSQDPSTASSTTVSADQDAQPSNGKPPPRSLRLSFHQHGFNTMAAYVGSKIRYHISIYMNCFIPSSFITVIRREREKGEIVGSFEMGISTQRATVTVHGVEKPMGVVLTTARRAGRKPEDRLWTWTWKDERGNAVLAIGWHLDSFTRYCYFLDGTGRPWGRTIAAFTSYSSAYAPQAPRLKIHPDGMHIADHVLTSALILERKRLTPATTSMSSIFN